MQKKQFFFLGNLKTTVLQHLFYFAAKQKVLINNASISSCATKIKNVRSTLIPRGDVTFMVDNRIKTFQHG